MGLGIKCTLTGIAQGIPPARGNYHRQSNVTTTWNEVRMGMLFQVIPATAFGGTNDGASVVETVTVASNLDWICIGMMNTRANSSIIPGTAGAQFAGTGYGVVNGQTVAAGSNSGGSSSLTGSYRKMITTNGVTIIGQDTASGGGLAILYAQYAAASGYNYASFYGMKIVVGNAGLSTQTLTIRDGSDLGPFSLTTQASVIPKLLERLTNVSWDTYSTPIAWNAGGVALPLPDCIFVRLPFYNNCLRMLAYEAVKIS
jgi:hypothetical protein